MINSVTEVQEGAIVEVILNTQPLGDEDVEIRPHSLSIHSYKTPTFCDFCREMLFGMFKQVNNIYTSKSKEKIIQTNFNIFNSKSQGP